MKKLIAFFLIIILLAGAFFAGSYYSKNKDLNNNEYTAKDVKAKLVEISELATYSCEYDVTIDKNDYKYLFGDIKLFFTTNNITLSASGIVKVGYDVDDIKINVEDNIIYLSIPEPKVLDNYVIWDSVTCKEKNNLINPIEFEQYKEIITEIESMGLEEAESAGIYNKADEHIKKIINGFLSKFSEYEIEYV